MINEVESACCYLRRFRSSIAWVDYTVDTSILHVIVINADSSSLSLLHTLTSAMGVIFACWKRAFSGTLDGVQHDAEMRLFCISHNYWWLLQNFFFCVYSFRNLACFPAAHCNSDHCRKIEAQHLQIDSVSLNLMDVGIDSLYTEWVAGKSKYSVLHWKWWMWDLNAWILKAHIAWMDRYAIPHFWSLLQTCPHQ